MKALINTYKSLLILGLCFIVACGGGELEDEGDSSNSSDNSSSGDRTDNTSSETADNKDNSSDS